MCSIQSVGPLLVRSETRELYFTQLKLKDPSNFFSNNKWILQYGNTQMEKAHSEIVKAYSKIIKPTCTNTLGKISGGSLHYYCIIYHY
jgi:hypothetical protein